MNIKDQIKHIEEMIAKASKAEKPDDAMKFSQAALNAANAVVTIKLNVKDG